MSSDLPTLRLGLLLGVLAPAAWAAEAGTRWLDFQVHGFASQGWVLSQGNNVNGQSDDKEGSGEFREVGLNASWRPLGSLLIAAQAAAVENGEAIEEDLALEYGVVDFVPVQAQAGRFGLRGGKLKLPIGLYNDARDNVFTRPGVILPNSVYLETNGVRAFGYFALVGGGLYGDWYTGDHAIYAEVVGAGPQRIGADAEIPILRRAASGRFDLDQGIIARIADDYAGGRWRFALSYLTADLAYVQAATDPAVDPFNRNGTFDFDQAVLSVQHNTESFSLTAEFVGRRIELSDISGPPFPFHALIGRVKQDPAGFYVQGAYRFTPGWQGFLRYDEQIRDLPDRSGHEQAQNVIQPSPRHYFFARDWTVGTRYDVLSNLSLWAEFHYVDGVGWVNPLDNPGFSGGGADRYWNFVTVMAGFRF